MSRVALTWPLTGRQTEREDLEHARTDPGCRGVVLEGDAGAGKSRLARETCEAWRCDGALVEWVQGTHSAAALPLGAFAGVFGDDDVGAEFHLIHRAGERLRARADGRPVVLGVDDAHTLDPVSAALVLHLATTGAAFVVATVRSGEPCQDAIVALHKDGGARRVMLGALDDEAVTTLAERALGAPLDSAARHWLVDNSAGNPLYLRELVTGALESDALRLRGGVWRRHGSAPVTGSLVELVAQRMRGLAALARGPLELLALSEPLTLDETAALTSTEAAVAAEAAGMVAVRGDELRLAHPLYGEVVQAKLPLLRARVLRLELADTLARRSPLTDADALRIARLRIDAGAELDTRLALRAARAGLAAGDPDFAATLALACGGGTDATLVLARARADRRRFSEAEALLAPLEGTLDDYDTAVAYLELRAYAVLEWGLLRHDDARALLERARGWWPDAAWQRRMDAFSLDDGFLESTKDAPRRLADPTLEPVVRRNLEARYAIRLFYTGRSHDAYDLCQRIRPDVPLRDSTDPLALTIWIAVSFETGEDWTTYEADLAALVRDGVRAGDHVAAGFGARGLGGLAMLAGRYADATRWFAEAETQLEINDAVGMLVVVQASQVGVAQALGDHVGAAAALKRMHASLGGRPPVVAQRHHVARAEAWATLARGDATGAQRLLLHAAARDANPNFKAQLFYEALRAGTTARTLQDEAVALAPLSRLAAAYAAHVRALAASDGEALLAAAEDFAAIGALRYAMEAAADASRAFHEVRKQDGARRALVRATELHREGAPPAVEGIDGGVQSLTPREAQLVELAARGLSSGEIAQQLVLSRRTVETHLYRAMQKLGISDRRRLPRLDASAVARGRERAIGR